MKIICIGRNYIDHIKELGHAMPAEPVFFLKPDTALLRNNEPFFIPDFSNEIHHEVEMVAKICRLGKGIEKKFAHRYYNEIGIGIDFTARDIQRDAIKNGSPWESSKAFDSSSPVCKRFIEKKTFATVKNISFRLDINGNTVQKGNTGNMLFSFDDIIVHVSKFITLKMGDLIYTGTPSGVGPVKIGDRLQAYIEDERMMDFYVK